MERKRHREWGEGSTFYIEIVKCPILRKNYDQTTLHNGAPCIKHPNACIGLIIPGLYSPSVCEFFRDNRPVLFDGQVDLVHGEFCAQIFTDVDVIQLELIVIVVVVEPIAVAVVVVVAIAVTVAVLAAVAVKLALQIPVITNAVTVAVLLVVATEAALVVIKLVTLATKEIAVLKIQVPVAAVIVLRYAVTQFVEALSYSLEGCGFDSRFGLCNFTWT